MTTTIFTCSKCKQTITHEITLGTGYGIDKDGNKTCYACCADLEKVFMKNHGKTILYFDRDKRTVIDWMGKLIFPLTEIRKGRHNMAGVRYDYWFKSDGYLWHGYTIGDDTQIAHCKRTKEKV